MCARFGVVSGGLNAEMMQAALIFLLRIIDVGLATTRFMLMARGYRLAVWVMGFIGSTIFISAIRPVIQDASNWGNVLAYAGGFATGMVIGMLAEERLAKGFTLLRIVSVRRGSELAEKLRLAGFAVTEAPARGRGGSVDLLLCFVRRKLAPEVVRLVTQIDEDAFVSSEAVRAVNHGYWRSY